MIYDIRLRIAHAYASPALGGRHVACVMPADIVGRQQVVAGLLQIGPRPTERVDRVDFFGNKVTEFALRDPHDRVDLTLQVRVERLADPASPPGRGARLSQLPQLLAGSRDLGPLSPLHYLEPSTRVPRDAALTAFGRAAIAPGMTIADAARAIAHALHRHLRFDREATNVDTPATEAFAKRRGVCQDYAHILLACLRGLGIPGRYMSGYLRTTPPKGRPRLEGADAMHAWVGVWCGPAAGWIDLDPTNDSLAGADHVRVALGRDYADVAPVKGIMRIAGAQKSRHSVDVVPAEI